MNPCLNKFNKVSAINFFIKHGLNFYNVEVALKFSRVGSGAYFSQHMMCWMFISQWFRISPAFISAIRQCELNCCKPSLSRAI